MRTAPATSSTVPEEAPTDTAYAVDSSVTAAEGPGCDARTSAVASTHGRTVRTERADGMLPTLRRAGKRPYAGAMSRLVLRAVGLVLLGLAVLFPAWWYDADGSLDRVDEPTRITSYSATFDVAEDGSMEVVETIVLAVGTGDRHGIFRYFDRPDENAWQLRRDPLDVTVSGDDESVPVRRTTEDRGRYAVLRIGDPDRALEVGERTYRISYTVEDVLVEDKDGEGSRFYWDLLPRGWRPPINHARLGVILPGEASNVQYAVGTSVTGGCPGPRHDPGLGRARHAAAYTRSATPRTSRAAAADPGRLPPWSQRFDPVLAPLPLVALVLLAELAAGAVAARVAHPPTSRSPASRCSTPLPRSAAQAAYLLDEPVNREQYVATVLHAARAASSHSTARPPAGRYTGRGLGDRRRRHPRLESLVGSRGFTAAADDVQAGKRLAADLRRSRVRRPRGRDVGGTSSPVRSAASAASARSFLVTLGLALALALWNRLDFSLLAIVRDCSPSAGSAC